MLWVDKYCPKTLDSVMVHNDIAQNLKKLVTDHDCPHLLFYGPSGAGKKTLIMALLRQMFGPGVDNVKVENRAWKVDPATELINEISARLSFAAIVHDGVYRNLIIKYDYRGVAEALNETVYVSDKCTRLTVRKST